MIIPRKRMLCMFFALAVLVQLGYYFEFLEFSDAPVETFDFRASRSPSSSLSPLLHPNSSLFAPLHVLCNKTVPRPNVFLNCSTISFPSFEAINQLQVCVRWAIDAGIGIIKPNFVTNVNISALPPTRYDLEFLLDEMFLWQALEQNCPNVKVVLSEQMKNETFVELDGDPFFSGKLYRKGSYSRYVQNRLLEEHINGTKVVIREDGSFCGWERRRDPLPVQLAFKHLFQFSKPLVAISLRILSRLPSSFFGVLLPAQHEHEHANGALTDELLDEVLRRNTSAYPCVYIASDNERAQTEFAHRAQLRGVNTTTRWNTTNAADAEWMLGALNAEQLRVVDHAVMEKAFFVFGSSGSIEAFMLGMDRHITQFGNLEYHGIDRQQYLIGSRLNLWDGNSW